jgi:hypothetical protein
MPESETAPFIAGLSQIAERVGAIAIPGEPFDPNANWSQTYTVLASDGGASHGHVTLSRTRHGDSGASLAVDWRKGAGGPTHWRLAGTIRTAGDALGAIRSWQSEGGRMAGFFDAPGEPIANLTVSHSGELSNGKLTVVSGPRASRQVTDVEAAVVANWQLFDVVQRLPRRAGEQHAFTLLDQFELVKPSQRLSYRGRVDTTIGGAARTLHGFDHVGFGMVPWVYWVDEQTGRLLAATSGLEAYVLGALPRGGGTDRAAVKAKKRAAAEQY